MFRHIIRTSWKDAGNATHACVWPSAGSQMCWEHRLRMGPHVAPCRCRVARGRAARAGPREAPVKLRCAGPGILPGRCLCAPRHQDEVVHEPRALEPCGGCPAAHSFPALSPPRNTSVSFPEVTCCCARVPTGCPIDCSVFGLMSQAHGSWELPSVPHRALIPSPSPASGLSTPVRCSSKTSQPAAASPAQEGQAVKKLHAQLSA